MAGGATSYLMVRILGDATGATQALAQTSIAVGAVDNSVKKSGKSWKMWGAAAAAAFGAAAIAGSRASEAMATLERVFGEQADEMAEFASSMTELGMSTTDAMMAASLYGQTLQNLGFETEQAAALTEKLLVLSLDMAAAWNKTVPEAILALGAAMRGEYDTIEKFGVTINQAMVETEMLRQASMGLTFESEQQAKMAAVLGLIWTQTANIHGAAAAEMDTVAGATRNLIASTKELATEVGTLAQDEMQGLIEALDRVIDGFRRTVDEEGLLDTALDTTQTLLQETAEILQPALTNALGFLDTAFETTAEIIETVFLPQIQEILDFLDRAIDKINETTEAVGIMGQGIRDTFDWIQNNNPFNDDQDWNYTQPGNPYSAMSWAAPGQQRSAVYAPTININTGLGGGDPHAIAAEVRKVLERDRIRMGRVVRAA